MERRIANWVELGVMPYSEVMVLQNKLADLRGQDLILDTVLSVQHPLTVSFGADRVNNQFSQALLDKVREMHGSGSSYNVEQYLVNNGIPIHIGTRGGGATVFAPGQFAFYPIVDHTQVTNSHQLDVGAYKSTIYKTMFDALTRLGVSGINTGSSDSFRTRQERRDAWIVRGGVTYKMGSKGIEMKGKVAYNGFALHIDEEGIAHNWIVNQCGYRPDEVKLWSVEQELGRKTKPEDVYHAVGGSIMRNFGYGGYQRDVITKATLMRIAS